MVGRRDIQKPKIPNYSSFYTHLEECGERTSVLLSCINESWLVHGHSHWQPGPQCQQLEVQEKILEYLKYTNKIMAYQITLELEQIMNQSYFLDQN